MPKLDATTTQRLDEVILEYITDWYRSARERSRPEPVASQFDIHEYLQQHAFYGQLRPTYTARQRSGLISQALARLVRKGLLETSIASGRTGAEVRAYSPKVAEVPPVAVAAEPATTRVEFATQTCTLGTWRDYGVLNYDAGEATRAIQWAAAKWPGTYRVVRREVVETVAYTVDTLPNDGSRVGLSAHVVEVPRGV